MAQGSVPVIEYGHAPEVTPQRVLRVLLRVAFGVLIVVGLLIAGVPIAQWWAVRHARSESIRVLAAAPNFEARKSLVKEGTWVAYPDGSWIVIRYICAHCSPSGKDVAIALDSAGQWYESNRHYCGGFMGAGGRTSVIAPATGATTEPVIEVEGDTLLCGVDTARDLPSARAGMLKLGFRLIAKPG